MDMNKVGMELMTTLVVVMALYIGNGENGLSETFEVASNDNGTGGSQIISAPEKVELSSIGALWTDTGYKEPQGLIKKMEARGLTDIILVIDPSLNYGAISQWTYALHKANFNISVEALK